MSFQIDQGLINRLNQVQQMNNRLNQEIQQLRNNFKEIQQLNNQNDQEFNSIRVSQEPHSMDRK
ncbi:hypothetical protein C2G38_2249711 [Gigaspora rosea]|uniref:Uncharacterized protein n=1 Tax=Gigaspora rosea TaxID=44941 RepID=A0A397US97_9GLOM|nr:hypothetical protein C2G38_2249711 [Gigaspora rosea]